MPTKSSPLRKALSRAALASVALACSLVASPDASARDRYGSFPAVRVSPALADEWILQLSPGSGVLPGYRSRDIGASSAATTGMDRSGIVLEGRMPGGRQHRQGSERAYPARRGEVLRVFDGTTGSIATATPRQIRRAGEGASVRALDPAYLPQTVDYDSTQPPGTIVIDTNAKFLYRIEGGGKAMRYGVGVGKPGFEWAGTHTVSQKREWPTWTPPAEMREREKARGRILPASMDGGPENPLGARAMYLGSTLYRIHGTNQPWTIGKAVSSGCIRMRNEDVIDLYEHVDVGTHVVVL